MATTDDDVTTGPRTFPALNLLERRAWPTLYGRDAYGRAPIPEPARKHPFIPSWNWTGVHTDLPEGEQPVNLDYNGSYMAALGSVEIAHSDLKRMGSMDTLLIRPRQVWPGYFKITVPRWAFGATIVSPLGMSPRLDAEKEIWIAHPTLVLLLELLEENSIEHFEITDSWVSDRKCNFRAWNVLLKQVRNALLDQRDMAENDDQAQEFLARYDAFKEGYGSAFSMMLTGEKCKTRRPDWAHAVYAQHAATSWRKAWRFSAIGPLLSMGSVDEITVLRADLARAVQRATPIVKLDPSGRTLGHLKEKPLTRKPELPAVSPDLIMSDTFEDVL